MMEEILERVMPVEAGESLFRLQVLSLLNHLLHPAFDKAYEALMRSLSDQRLLRT